MTASFSKKTLSSSLGNNILDIKKHPFTGVMWNNFSLPFSVWCQLKGHTYLKSLVTIRMNEIFPCLVCCGQKLKFTFGNRDKDKHKLSERSGEDEMGIIILKSDIYDAFQTFLAWDHSKIVILYTSYITQVYFTLNLFTIHVVIIKIWMDNWRMGLANLE